ncbi:MAG: hypothetical protein KGI25_10050 [Thaumarchaeota archaeon]|nr:hypothetical protein [Nitrososphaerota archaeon]
MPISPSDVKRKLRDKPVSEVINLDTEEDLLVIDDTNLDIRFNWKKIRIPIGKLGRKTFAIRSLTRREFEIAQSKKEPVEGESYILRTAVLPKFNWDDAPNLVTVKVLEQVYKQSGISQDSDNKFVDDALEWIKSRDGCLEAVAIMMIPSCSPEALYNCSPEVYAKYLVTAAHQFELMTGKTVYSAFGLDGNSEPVPNSNMGSKTSQPMPTPGFGEKAEWEQERFTWRKGQ